MSSFQDCRDNLVDARIAFDAAYIKEHGRMNAKLRETWPIVVIRRVWITRDSEYERNPYVEGVGMFLIGDERKPANFGFVCEERMDAYYRVTCGEDWENAAARFEIAETFETLEQMIDHALAIGAPHE